MCNGSITTGDTVALVSLLDVSPAYKNLAPKTRLGVGVAVIAWGIAGLYISDKAEESLGFKPTEEDKAELRNMAPRITAVDKPQDQSSR
ncbi:hypothetical protein J3F83DRAFT_710864 [Trichoderma novae-zelandiae]